MWLNGDRRWFSTVEKKRECVPMMCAMAGGVLVKVFYKKGRKEGREEGKKGRKKNLYL